MTPRRLLSVAALLALSAAPALAQTAAPTQPAAPAVAAPAKTTATPVATAPIVKKINLNTATATELGTMPQISPVLAKAIVDARAKSPFKNWDDFVARKVMPSNVEAAIKDKVTF